MLAMQVLEGIYTCEISIQGWMVQEVGRFNVLQRGPEVGWFHCNEIRAIHTSKFNPMQKTHAEG
jgi:hypothetical protein